MVNRARVFGFLLGLAVLAGCASPPPLPPPVLGPAAMDEAYKRFGSNPRLARVYVYRNSRHGRSDLLALRVDGVEVGTVGPYTYMPMELTPGVHRLAARNEKETALDLSVLAGRSYFVKLGMEISMEVGKPEFAEMHPLEGKYNIINECVAVMPSQFGFEVAP